MSGNLAGRVGFGGDVVENVGLVGDTGEKVVLGGDVAQVLASAALLGDVVVDEISMGVMRRFPSPAAGVASRATPVAVVVVGTMRLLLSAAVFTGTTTAGGLAGTSLLSSAKALPAARMQKSNSH